MNRRLILIILSAAAVIGAASLWQRRAQDKDSLAAHSPQVIVTEGALGVEQFMRAVDNHRGTVMIEGAVSTVAPEEQGLTLIDLTEFERCGVVTCAPLSLPVKWAGKMPAVRDIIRLKGEVSESEGKLFFLAAALEKVEPETTGTP